MYCPNCGKADQKEKSYCRQCGEFIPNLSISKSLAWGGSTPQTQVNTTLVLNAISAIASLVVGILLISNLNSRGDLTFLITLAAGLLLTIGLWQIANFTVGLKLRRHFTKSQNSEEDVPNSIAASTTNELLPAADLDSIVPTSVTENTTRNLKQEVRR